MFDQAQANGQWEVHACAVLGSRPDNANVDWRYIYTIPFGGGVSPATNVAQCPVNTTTDTPPVNPAAAQVWHSYPPNNPAVAPLTCNDQRAISTIAADGTITFRAAVFVDYGAQH